jgi:hypothetical protein
MNNTDIPCLPATQLAVLLKSGDISPLEAIEALAS